MSTITSSYLTEDLAQIMRYFPGAQPVTLNTPFDLTDRPVRRKTVRPQQSQPTQTPDISSAPGNTAILAACLVPLVAHRSSPWTI